MAPLPIIPDVYRVTFEWNTIAGLPSPVNVMHFEAASSNAAAVAAAIDAHVTANMWAHTTTAYGINTQLVTPLDGGGSSVAVNTGRPAKWSGTNAVGDIIPQAAQLVKLLTDFRGRSHRGRAFLPFVAEASASNGQSGSFFGAAQQTAWSNFLTAMNTALVFPVVASYKLASADHVTQYAIEQFYGTQRRRQPRGA